MRWTVLPARIRRKGQVGSGGVSHDKFGAMATDITTELQDLKTDPAMQKHFEELDEYGYTILEDTLTPRQVDEAIREIEITYREGSATEHEPGTLRTHNLSARAEVFREMLQVPRVMACLAYLLGDDYILCDSGARSPMPGMQAQGLHRDGDDFMPNPPYKVHAVVPTFAQSLFALSEFTAESGATRFVPGRTSRTSTRRRSRPRTSAGSSASRAPAWCTTAG